MTRGYYYRRARLRRQHTITVINWCVLCVAYLVAVAYAALLLGWFDSAILATFRR